MEVNVEHEEMVEGAVGKLRCGWEVLGGRERENLDCQEVDLKAAIALQPSRNWVRDVLFRLSHTFSLPILDQIR